MSDTYFEKYGAHVIVEDEGSLRELFHDTHGEFLTPTLLIDREDSLVRVTVEDGELKITREE